MSEFENIAPNTRYNLLLFNFKIQKKNKVDNNNKQLQTTKTCSNVNSVKTIKMIIKKKSDLSALNE